MLTIGIVVEGDYDAKAIPEFIRSVMGSGTNVMSRPCGGTGNLMKKLPGFLEEFRYLKQGAPIDQAFVIRDADNRMPDALRDSMREKYANRAYPFPVEPVIIVRALETWLLSDPTALSRIIGRDVAETTGNLEAIPNPKQRLQTILSQHNILYTAEIARKIAAETNPDTLAYRCPSFQSFRSVLL
jgi:hypothetical protein